MTSKPKKVRSFGMKREGYLFTTYAVSGIKGARAWLWRWYGTWEPVAVVIRPFKWGKLFWWLKEGEPQAEETVRGRVPLHSTGTDYLVVVVISGNTGGAKEMGHLGELVGQPYLYGRSL